MYDTCCFHTTCIGAVSYCHCWGNPAAVLPQGHQRKERLTCSYTRAALGHSCRWGAKPFELPPVCTNIFRAFRVSLLLFHSWQPFGLSLFRAISSHVILPVGTEQYSAVPAVDLEQKQMLPAFEGCIYSLLCAVCKPMLVCPQQCVSQPYPCLITRFLHDLCEQSSL